MIIKCVTDFCFALQTLGSILNLEMIKEKTGEEVAEVSLRGCGRLPSAHFSLTLTSAHITSCFI